MISRRRNLWVAAALAATIALLAGACAADDSASGTVDAANAAVASAQGTVGEAKSAAADAAATASSAAAAATEAQAAAGLAQATAEGNQAAVEQAEAALTIAQAAAEDARAQAESAQQDAAAAQEDAEMAQLQAAVTAGDYRATIRPAKQAWKIGYGDGFSGIPFTDSVTDSINAVADEMGVEIIYCDNAVDQEKTLNCTNLIIAQGADGVVFANWIGGTEDLIAGIYTDAGLPCVSYDGPHPGCAAFGPDNYRAAQEAGRYLGQLAADQGWDPAETELIILWNPDVPVLKERRDGSIAGVTDVFAIPPDNIHTDIPHKDISDVLPLVRDWVTAHPDAQNVLCFGHSDQPGVDCALALEEGGFLGRAAAASLGASDEALVDLRDRTDDESIFKATISYFPERYGQYLVPAIVDLLEGRPVPDRIIPDVSPVTRENVQELYPG